MPVALDVNWEAVRAHAVTHGAREAARAFELSENTVMARCRREGWLVNAGKSVELQPLPKSMQPAARDARITPEKAARYSVENLKSRSRYRLMKVVDKGALAMAKMSGPAIVANAQQGNALANMHAKLCPPDQSTQQSPLLLLSITGCPSVTVEHGQATDV
jgi:hypothetical protein